MSRILCLETSTTNCSVCIGESNQILALKEFNSVEYSHAEKLHSFIDDVCKENHIVLESLDAISVSKGPGSYTGLRIGVSAAKGLAFALDKPLISVPTLLVLAKQIEIESGLIVPMLDARRMEVYSEIYTSDFEIYRSIEAEILDKDSYSEELQNHQVHFIGSGVEKFESICRNPNAIFYKTKLPSAQEQYFAAQRKFDLNDFEDVAYFEPYYLKDFVPGR
ncbi:tRNA (adenosine(37)-N6)-threonylcarbamoyltransferase complex dimerization subunit type 1 TsaB [Psychroflexus aestuariivivens]|uniref:tRNA (adenosine(37)-N6)-threonylcarbamoyltransferase complex dimerization subunit type 1 TsaB n=1 Tax=Psychroflexus aestuariivivens TaxID=1795040 RepID=UPI000FDB9279|nr:tRNA (adenosine(37)-N6)-threonylcarbamoyltransferase complex dimerization subunit type 1 TsaB [Psychroflexus aestuariivivens]